MDWSEFEYCVDNLLNGAIATSVLFGGTEPGSGYPDGALTFHWTDNQELHVWDAKFVDLTKNNETNLEDEYDKIFRHISEMHTQPSNQRTFGGVSGMVLFSPGIKEANIVRLAEFIHERQLLKNVEWKGWVVYFSLTALLELYHAFLANDGDVHQKPEAFHQGFHRLLTSPSRHEDGPDSIADSPYNSVHVSEQDISNLFNYIDTQPLESDEFDREAYAEFREWNYQS